MPSRTVELEGHIIDSGMMGRAFGVVMDMGGSFHVEQFDVGTRKDETSYCRMSVAADTAETLQSILHELHQTGATVTDAADATLEPAPADRVVPPGFYSTTNHPTEVRYEGRWLPVEHVEMDCAVVVEPADGSDESHGATDEPDDQSEGSTDTPDADATTGADPRVHTKPLHAVEAGDLIVTGETGVRVRPPERPRSADDPFGFMQGGVSSERPSGSLVRRVANAITETVENNGEVLVVPGPAVIHAGGGDALARLVREGYVTMLSAGNGFATHDIERSVYGTSLGMDMETMDHPRKGHKHHIYAIGEVVRAGSIADAVEQGVVESGVMYECVESDVPFVLAGSIRDDGPLPDTITDTIEAQDAIREQAREADLVVTLATMLHSVAVGNCLPSTTPTVCVDIDPATVTQLLDRGSAQAVGMVTDVGMFLPRLADRVVE
ncbi:MAG: TIGR00300 family protein [Halobaculum sp.]